MDDRWIDTVSGVLHEDDDMNECNVMGVFRPLDFTSPNYHTRLNKIWSVIPTTAVLNDPTPFDSRTDLAFQIIVDFLTVKSPAHLRDATVTQQFNMAKNLQQPDTNTTDSNNDDSTVSRTSISQRRVKMSFMNILESLKYADCRNTNHRESLLEHSVYCMVWNLFLMRCGTVLEQATYGLLGLLHDVGKDASKLERLCSGGGSANSSGNLHQPQSASLSSSFTPDENLTATGYLSFPYHGEISCSVSYAFYSEKHAKIIPRNVWNSMCQAMRTHMCGYHCTGETDDHLQKWNLLRHESFETKEMLTVLSVADVYARVSNNIEPFWQFFNNRTTFSNYLNAPVDLALLKSCIPHTVKKMSKGMLITLRSVLADEKNDTLNRVKKFLIDNQKIEPVCVSRDGSIADFIKSKYPDKFAEINADDPKFLPKVYAIYSPDSFTRGVNVKLLNESIRAQIKKALGDGRVVIYDDSATLFGGSRDLYPSEVRSAFKVAIDVKSVLKTNGNADKHFSMQRHLNCLGAQSWSLVPPSSAKCLNNMRSCMSAKTALLGLESVVTAHLVYPVVYNDDFSHSGLDDAFRGIELGLRLSAYDGSDAWKEGAGALAADWTL
jgi:hypothetical protein